MVCWIAPTKAEWAVTELLQNVIAQFGGNTVLCVCVYLWLCLTQLPAQTGGRILMKIVHSIGASQAEYCGKAAKFEETAACQNE